MSFHTLPSNASLTPTSRHTTKVSNQDIDEFKQLLKLSKIGPATYENSQTNGHFGISREWLSRSKAFWESDYDWQKTETRLNSFPNFVVPIEDQGVVFNVHFTALFSQKPGAAPLLLLHGWPGSILEFLGVLDLLRTKYSPAELPFHVVVPSIPGYGYSSGPPLDRDFKLEDVAAVLDKLMLGLGFGSGYFAQGGDIGSFLARILGATSDSCKAVHREPAQTITSHRTDFADTWKVNLAAGATPPNDETVDSLSEAKKAALSRAQEFGKRGTAYALEHSTRPATIGLALSASPLALLAWVGEKFLAWSDEDPPLDHILDSVTLYWFTQSFPRGIYPYRQLLDPSGPATFHGDPKFFINKPLGYSWFPKEIAPMPRSWVAQTGNFMWFRAHAVGGHFAAMEQPELFLTDMEDFIAAVLAR